MIAGLRQAGFTSAFLIGEAGSPLSNDERPRIAEENGAALLLSLHHDAVQPLYLLQWSVNGRVQHYSDRFHGYSVFISGKNAHANESKQYATMLGEALLSEGLTPSLHHAEKIHGESRTLINARIGLYRFDDLEVLKAAPMPAGLLESAVIVNRAEEQQSRQRLLP